MKKNYLLLAFMLITIPGISQVEFGFFGGPQATYTSYSVRHIKQENEVKFGFQAGAGLRVPFENKLYFAPLGYYSLKGYKVTLTQAAFPPDSTAINNNTTIHTFELAALLEYHFSEDPGHFFVRLGPSLDFQLFGKEKYNTASGGTVNRNMKFSFGDYGHFAASMVLHIGYETSGGIIFFAHYAHGLGSINNADYGPRILHRAAGISIGKYLSRKK